MARRLSKSRSINVCFVTGTRAEFGLMGATLKAIAEHPRLRLQLIVTGMHLDARHGRSVAVIREGGWRVDATVPWPSGETRADSAVATGRATAGLARAFGRLQTDVVLVVGDRVEAFAAATAGHLAGLVVAHIHGGDRALGQVDDALRHAITKLAHVHFPATGASAKRIVRLGEDPQSIHTVGSPGLDGIREVAASGAAVSALFPQIVSRQFALLILHPTSTDETLERSRAELVRRAVERTKLPHVIAIYPNNDPGAAGIIASWDRAAGDKRWIVRRDLGRAVFLGLMREAAVLVGNSSSGIIEAASFATPVVDIGPRQQGRERGRNVVNVPFEMTAICAAIANALTRRSEKSQRHGRDLYGDGLAGPRIAAVLGRLPSGPPPSKLICY